MFRVFALLSVVALLLYGCGQDPQPSCSGRDPDFTVVLKLMGRPLPPDTVVHVAYAGSGVENFRLSEPNAPTEVTFCQVADEDGVPVASSAPQAGGADGAAGAAGAASVADSDNRPQSAAALYCRLYTAGFTQLKITGTGFETANYDLAPKEGRCTVHEPPFVLDSPDAGSR